MTDKELLELAAKAAGIELLGRSYLLMEEKFIGFTVRGQKIWNPLNSDSDALRLAVKLEMEVDIPGDPVAVRTKQGFKILESYKGDPYAATRRAIVRAAAEIARGMG